MAKAISLKILKLQYGGESVGNNILLEIEIAGEKFSSYQTVKRGTTFEYNQEVKQFRGVENTVEIPFKIRVTEKDFLFSDVGETAGVISVDSNFLPKTFDFQVKVQERNKLTFSKLTAIFSITLEAREFNPIYPSPQIYKNPSKKDYNRFDVEIANAVGQWNDEFLNQEYPPLTPLDPSLVKAMIFQESTMGYSKKKRGHVDIMQVGTPGDPALHTLNNDGWIYPDTGKIARENEWKDGKVQVLDCHGEANVETWRDSLKWGVRWLYHKAQYIEDNRRKWFTWEKAVKRYGPQSKKEEKQETSVYQQSVLNIYYHGVSPDSKPLWNAVAAILFLFIIGGSFFGIKNVSLDIVSELQSANIVQIDAFKNLDREFSWRKDRVEYLENRLEKISNINHDPLKNAIWKMFTQEDQDETEDIETVLYDKSLFATIIEYQKDWWEDFEIGQYKNGEVKWLKLEGWPEKAYMENSILSAKWINLKGMTAPILEVYGTTHMGNGNMYLFKVSGNKYSLIFSTRAVSGFWPTGNSPSQDFKKYGYANCQETFKNRKLEATYEDLNADGISDLILMGATEVVCDDGVVVDTIPIKEKFILNPDSICSVDKYFIFNCE